MAKVAAVTNPYAVNPEITDTPSYALPDSRDYAIPAPNSDEENGYLDSPSGAWTAKLRSFPGGTPDPMRTGAMPERDFRPNPRRAPEEFWSDREGDKDSRDNAAHVMQDADGWEENKGTLRRFAANPRSIPGPEPRPTSRLAPRTYLFSRDMWGGPMRNNGQHFSMADFRRDYPILGTQPVRTWRNTYRIQPVPFDGDMVDIPADNSVMSIPDQVIQSPEPAIAGAVWRLS